MSWFVLALVCTLGWGFADLFYKLSTDESDKDSQYKISVWVGLLMGIVAFILLPFTESGFSVSSFFENAVKYSPASLSYIVSMVIGYAGLRYLELSIVSPLENASGALSLIAMLIFFMITGQISGFWDEFSVLEVIGTMIIIAGVIALAVVEKKLSKDEERKADKKYRIGALALLFPLFYCIFDTIGTAADGIILDEEAGLGLGEIDVTVLYGFTFLLAGIIIWFILLLKNKKAYNPFKLREVKTKGVAAVFEQFGQIFYVFAMAKKPMLAAPMIASYCIVSVILSRFIVKEKLEKSQYACIIAVIAGIVILGISDGLSS